MTHAEPVARLAESASRPEPGWRHPLAAIGQFVLKALVIAELEARKLRHDPSELLTRAVQPALWLLVFGQVFTRIRAIPTGDLRYLDFMAPGILAQSVLFISIFYGISIIWERDLGIVHKFLVTPTPRAAIVAGKALSAGVRGLSQAVIVYALAAALDVKIAWNPLALLGVVAVVILGAALFSTFSLIVACVVKTRERFMGIGQIMTMPLFFASNAIYPIAIMPVAEQARAFGFVAQQRDLPFGHQRPVVRVQVVPKQKCRFCLYLGCLSRIRPQNHKSDVDQTK